MVYSGAWGKLINEKNQKSKISWHCPFKLSGNKNLDLLDLGSTQYLVYTWGLPYVVFF